MQKISKIADAKTRLSQKIGANYTKKFVNYTDPVTNDNFQLKIEELKFKKSSSPLVKITLPVEKNFFNGVKFSEKVRLEKLAHGEWIKVLHAKFGAGAKELFGLTEINEQSELEARDVRIIAAAEEILNQKAHKVSIKKMASAQTRKAHI